MMLPTMIPTDCSMLRIPTLLPIIRISWELPPAFMLILGQVPSSFNHIQASLCGFSPFDLGIIILRFLLLRKADFSDEKERKITFFSLKTLLFPQK